VKVLVARPEDDEKEVDAASAASAPRVARVEGERSERVAWDLIFLIFGARQKEASKEVRLFVQRF
jgi:hypothetical protein